MWIKWLGDFIEDLTPEKPFRMVVLRSKEQEMTEERHRLQTGVSAEQVDAETLQAHTMHEQRLQEGDAAAALQSIRQGGGSVADLSPHQIQALFNPDGTLTDAEVRTRIDWYNSLDRQTIPGPVNMHVGHDPTTGQQRMTNPGEMIQDGTIVMVNPQYAAEAAERMRDIDPRRAKQSMRRSAALRNLAQVVLNPVTDPTGVQFYRLDDQQFGTLKSEYQEAKLAGVSDSDMDFLPLYAYAHKLWPPDGSILRPKIANECGFFQMATNPGSHLQGKIACLNSAHLTPELRTSVQVPVTTALSMSSTRVPVAQVPQPPPLGLRPRRKSGVIVDKAGNAINNQMVMEPIREENMFGKAGVYMKPTEHRMQPAAIQPVDRPELEEEPTTMEDLHQRYVSVEPTAPQQSSPPQTLPHSNKPSVDSQGLPPPPPRRR